MVNKYEQQVPLSEVPQPAQEPVQQVPSMGQGLQALGAGLIGTSEKLSELDNYRKRSSAMLWATNALSQNKLAATKKYYALQNDPSTKDTGVSGPLSNYYDDLTQQTLASAPDDTTRYYYQRHADVFRSSLSDKALEYDNKVNSLNSLNKLQSTLDNNIQTAILDKNPNKTEYLHSSIDALNTSGLSTEAIAKQYQQVINHFNQSMLDNANATTPTLLHEQTGALLNMTTANTPEAMIYQAAKEGKNDPAIYLALAHVESRLNPTAKNTSSSAAGLFQITNATAESLGINNNIPEENVKGGIKLTDQNISSLKSYLGREPSLTEIDMAHKLGVATTKQVLNASDDAQLSSVLPDEDIQANKNWSGLTVGQFKQNLQGEMQLAYEKYKISPNLFAAPRSMILQYYHKSADGMKSEIRQEKINLEGKIKDQAAASQNGILPDAYIPADTFQRVYGDNWETKFNEYQDNMITGHAIHDMSTKSYDDRVAILQKAANDLTNKQGTEGYAQDLKHLQHLQKANAMIGQQLENNPADWITQHNPQVQKLYNDYQQISNSQVGSASPQAINGSWQAYASALKAAEIGQGAPVKLLSKYDENDLVSKINNLSGQELNTFLKDKAQMYGSYWNDIFGQLSKNKNLSSSAMITPLVSDPSLQDDLARVGKTPLDQLKSGLNPEDIKGLGETLKSEKNISKLLSSMPPSNENSAIAKAYSDNIYKLALSYMQQGAGVSDALTKADNILTSSYQFEQNKVTNTYQRIPSSINIDDLKNQQKSIDLNNVMLPINNTNVDDKTLKDEYTGMIKDNAVWMTNKDETASNLYVYGYNGRLYPVLDKNGSQVNVPFNQGITANRIAMQTTGHYEISRPNISDIYHQGFWGGLLDFVLSDKLKYVDYARQIGDIGLSSLKHNAKGEVLAGRIAGQ